MRRVQLFEFEDLPWVPALVRDGGTDLLDLAFGLTGFYRPLVPALARVLEESRAEALLDLCSGGGGGALAMRGELARAGHRGLRWQLTDRYPNEAARARVEALGDPLVRYDPEPLDALEATPSRRGLRTMFGALHHFTEPQVERLLAATMASRAPFAFFDVAASPALRSLPAALAPLPLAANMALLFAGSLALVPLVHPWRASCFAATYALPLIPALVAWDGTVSALRAYAPEELLALARGVPGSSGYELRAERAGAALSLTGLPR